MKNSQEIISHLYFSNSKKLRNVRCLNILKSLLPPRLATAISYIYKKNQNLYIVIDQFCLKMEFNYKRELIKSLLKSINKQTELCEDIKNLNIIISVSIKHKKKQEHNIKKYSYKERASGEFKNLAKDEKIHEIIEKIRECIVSLNEY